MSELFYLTHTQSLGSLSDSLVLKKTASVRDYSLVSYLQNVHAPVGRMDFVIATSFTSLLWLAPYFQEISHLYCVGPQSAAFARDLGYQGNLGYCESDPSFLNLVRQYDLSLSRIPVIWLGSAQGAWKHRKIFLRYPLMTPHITHWNWPNYEAAKRLSKEQPGTIICSSLAASLALSSQKWSPFWEVILSSPRLEPIVAQVFSPEKIRVSSWIKKILADL